MQDVIEKEIIINADPAKVYNAIADPKQIVTWFPDEVLGAGLEVGEQPVFHFIEHEHKARIYVEAANPNDYFAYRWIPGGTSGEVENVLDHKTTLVEFFVKEHEGQTKVILKESGFSSLPAEVAEQSFKDNNGGWDFMMGRLESKLNS